MGAACAVEGLLLLSCPCECTREWRDICVGMGGGGGGRGRRGGGLTSNSAPRRRSERA